MKSKKIIAALALVSMLFSTVGSFAADRDFWKKSPEKLFATKKQMAQKKTLRATVSKTPKNYYFEANGHLFEMDYVNEAFAKNPEGFLADLKVEKAVKPVNEKFKVVSVSAINAKELEITFSKPLDKSTVISNTGMVSNITISALEGQPYTLGQTKAKLSADKKILTLVPRANEFWDKSYSIAFSKQIKSEDKLACEEKTDIFRVSDKIAPTLVETKKLDASSWELVFSEPIKENTMAGAFNFVDGDGNVVAVAATQMDADDLSNHSVKLTIDGAVSPGAQLTGTALGLSDYAGNFTSPNPIKDIKIDKGNKDGVKPEIASIVALDDKTLEFKFSEEVRGFDDALARAMTYSGTNIAVAADVAASVKQDSEDKTKYLVTLGTSRLSSGNESIMQLIIPQANYDKITDLSGEIIKASGANYTSGPIVVKKDQAKPKYVSHEVVNGKLTIVFDKALNANPLTFSDAESYKNYVTTSGAFVSAAQTLSADEKSVTVDLTAAGTTFAGTSLVAGTHYTMNITATGKNTIVSDKAKIEFDYDQVATDDKPTVNNITQVATDNTKVEVVFDKIVDGATAVDTNNYSISGLEVKNAIFNGTTKVTLTISEFDTNGDKNVIVRNVKAKNGAVMDESVKKVTLKENKAPILKSAKITADNKILLTFSEKVSIGANKVKLKVNNVNKPVTNAAVVVGSEALTVEVSITTALTVDELTATNKVISFDSAAAVKDVNNNPMDLSVEMNATN